MGYNVVIAALNNKISTIRAALAAFDDPDIQLCYAQANHYNYESYSQPGADFYIFEIPDFIQPESEENGQTDKKFKKLWRTI